MENKEYDKKEILTNKDVEENNETDKDNLENELDINKFEKVISDFIEDIKNTFPEYTDVIELYYEDDALKVNDVYNHCKDVYPERFFDILYKNEEMMNDESLNTFFLPNIEFKKLWNSEGITESIKETIWKYLQLVLLSLVENIKDKTEFGDTAKLFEAMDNDIFKEKMQDTMKNIQDLLGNLNFGEDDDEENENDNENENENKNKSNSKEGFLNPENIQEHISTLLDGKLGKLANEIAEETAADLGIDITNEEDSKGMNDIMKDLFSNPSKIMDLVKKVGGKLDDKIKKGDIKESELLDEAGNIMKMMKDMPGMPGMKDMNKILKSMGMGNMMPPGMGGKNTKFNTGAMKSHLKKKEMQDRIRKKAQEKVKKMSEDKRIQEEFEEKKRSFINNKEVTEKSVDDLLKEFNLLNNNEETKETNKNKKKKKKTKK
tara:strand:+ start:868 stop:2166 length:1299 start_codon:yes stop_codon:yes gene_type:complete